MPKKIYNKEQILDDCLEVFANHGYDNTSTLMLAEAAGISRTLIFHHFKGKKELYLDLLDRCFEKGKVEMGFDTLPEYEDFFKAKEKFSIIKFQYYKNNPVLYKFVIDAFYETPEELKTEIKEKYGELIANKNLMWEQMFKKVNLNEGIDSDQAFQLVMLALDYCDNKYLSELENETNFNDANLQKFIEERNSFLSMIRFGIEKTER
jgi:AcrR family transcriptional regulator